MLQQLQQPLCLVLALREGWQLPQQMQQQCLHAWQLVPLALRLLQC
jgi:hypothetical protein